jgi:hypothetical protein
MISTSSGLSYPSDTASASQNNKHPSLTMLISLLPSLRQTSDKERTLLDLAEVDRLPQRVIGADGEIQLHSAECTHSATPRVHSARHGITVGSASERAWPGTHSGERLSSAAPLCGLPSRAGAVDERRGNRHETSGVAHFRGGRCHVHLATHLPRAVPQL